MLEDTEELDNTSLLMQCLTIIGRHFDNIPLIVRSNFINCSVEICHHLLNECSPTRALAPEEENLVRVCCEFLQLIYDPFLKWPYYSRAHRLFSGGSSYHVDPQLHLEIVPFIYTCFEGVRGDKRAAVDALGVYLLNVLGAIIVGSPRNARLVICPATINVIMTILADWRSSAKLRRKALDNVNLMLIMLVKSNPVERQIEVDIVVQEYLMAMQSLLKEGVPESSGDDDPVTYDENALMSLVQNIGVLLSEPSTRGSLCNSLVDGNAILSLAEIPRKVIDWRIDTISLMSTVIETMALVSYSTNQQVPEKALRKLFAGLGEASLTTSGGSQREIVQQCLRLATNPNDPLVIHTMVVNEIISWLPKLVGDDQEVVVASLMDVCAKNSNR